MEFGKPKLPSLAFWKKGDDSELPPPPARHFDPSRFGGGAETQVADAGSATRPVGSSTRSSGSSTRATDPKFDQYGMRIKDSVNDVSDMASESIASAKSSVEKFGDRPMRKPYQLDDIGGEEVLSKAENRFNLDTENLKNRLNDVKTASSNQLSNAQQDFRSAMSSAAVLKSAGEDAVKSASNSFAGGDNSFVAKPIAKAAETVKGFGGFAGKSFTPKTDAFANVKQAAADLSASANGSLYDAQGRLQSSASKIGNRVQEFAQSGESNRLKSEFEQRLLSAQQRAKEKSGSLATGMAEATNNQLNSLAKVSDRTKNLINKPFPKIGADGSLLPHNSGQTNFTAKQPALQPNNSPLLQISKPNALAANSFGAEKNAAVQQMRSEVEEAKRQIALLKAQVAAAKRSAAAVQQPIQRVAQNTIEGVVLPLDRVNDAFNPKAGSPVANQQYQGQSYAPAVPQSQSPGFNSNGAGDSNSFYPATPYGGFGSTQNANGTVGQAGFNSANEFQNRVSKANVEAPVDLNSSGIPRASRIGRSATEILIPSEILSGSSSFSPGSTTPLRQ